MRPLPSKLQSIIDVPKPTNKVELQRYLGMVNFYHRFLPGIAASLSPLHSLVAAAKAAKTKLVWDKAAVSAYEKSKEKLFSPVLLAHPRPKAKLTLTTDASDIAIGAVLAQEDGRPLGFFSRKLSAAQQKYSAFDKELLGIKEAIRHFRHMVEGRQFTVYTDHKPLTLVMPTATSRTPRQEWHLSYISEFKTDIRMSREMRARWPTTSPGPSWGPSSRRLTWR